MAEEKRYFSGMVWGRGIKVIEGGEDKEIIVTQYLSGFWANGTQKQLATAAPLARTHMINETKRLAAAHPEIQDLHVHSFRCHGDKDPDSMERVTGVVYDFHLLVYFFHNKESRMVKLTHWNPQWMGSRNFYPEARSMLEGVGDRVFLLSLIRREQRKEF